MKNIWADKRSWDDGMTAFFGVHLLLVIVSLTLGAIIGVLGIRALQARTGAGAAVERRAAGRPSQPSEGGTIGGWDKLVRHD